MTVPNTSAQEAAPNNRKKNVMFKNCASFTNCITEINNTQVNDAHDTDVVMRMYKLTEYSDFYFETSENY